MLVEERIPTMYNYGMLCYYSSSLQSQDAERDLKNEYQVSIHKRVVSMTVSASGRSRGRYADSSALAAHRASPDRAPDKALSNCVPPDKPGG